jgi:hypothetical protein
MDWRFDRMDLRFEELDERLESNFASVTDHFAEQRAYTEFAYARSETGLDRLDRKIDNFIDRTDSPGFRPA